MSLLMILISSVAAFGAAAETAALTQPFDAWSASAQGIWSYDVTLHLIINTFSTEDKVLVLVHDDVLRQRYMRGSWRVDFLETNGFARGREPERWKTSEGEVRTYLPRHANCTIALLETSLEHL